LYPVSRPVLPLTSAACRSTTAVRDDDGTPGTSPRPRPNRRRRTVPSANAAAPPRQPPRPRAQHHPTPTRAPALAATSHPASGGGAANASPTRRRARQPAVRPSGAPPTRTAPSRRDVDGTGRARRAPRRLARRRCGRRRGGDVPPLRRVRRVVGRGGLPGGQPNAAGPAFSPERCHGHHAHDRQCRDRSQCDTPRRDTPRRHGRHASGVPHPHLGPRQGPSRVGPPRCSAGR